MKIAVYIEVCQTLVISLKKIKFQLYCVILFALCVCQPLSADVLPKCMETENTYPIYLKCDDDKIVVICIDKDVGEGSFSATKKVYQKDRLIKTVEAHYDDFFVGEDFLDTAQLISFCEKTKDCWGLFPSDVRSEDISEIGIAYDINKHFFVLQLISNKGIKYIYDSDAREFTKDNSKGCLYVLNDMYDDEEWEDDEE